MPGVGIVRLAHVLHNGHRLADSQLTITAQVLRSPGPVPACPCWVSTAADEQVPPERTDSSHCSSHLVRLQQTSITSPRQI